MNKIMLVLTLSLVFAQWQLVSEDLMSLTVSSSTWNYRSSCDWNTGTAGTSSVEKTCTSNNLKFIIVKSSSNKQAYQDNTDLPPHYEAKVIVDGVFADSDQNQQYTIKYDVQGSTTPTYSFSYKDNSLSSGLVDNCNSSWGRYAIQTFMLKFTHNDNSSLRFRVCGNNFQNGQYFGFRSLQIYVNRCHWSCLTCETGSQSNKCKSCYTNPTTTLGTAGTCSACPFNYAFIEYLDNSNSCTTECHYYRIPDKNKVCQFNENMLPFITYFDSATFTSLSPWVFQSDPTNTNIINPTKIQQIPCYTSKNYVGPFYYNEGISVSLSLPNYISYIRFRVTLLKFGTWPDLTSIYVWFDNIQMVTVYSMGDVLYDKNAQNIYLDKNCTSPTVTYYRIETKLYTNSTNPILLIKGNMDQTGLYYWGFRNIVMDYMTCQSTCTQCDYNLKCYACSSGYLHKNRCVPSCPVYSIQGTNTCTDYDEAVASINSFNLDSEYIVKAFYDTGNTTDTDISNIVGTMTGGTNDFLTQDTFLGSPQPFFGYFSASGVNKRVLGGNLVWNKATFTKTFTQLKQHYQVNLKFKMVFGDDFGTGTFIYTIGGTSNTLTTTATGIANTANNYGKSLQDYFLSQDVTINHSDVSLDVVFQCNSANATKDSFCIVYDYFLILYKVQQVCGDMLVSDGEDCDDGNNIRYDGCNNCQYECQVECSICQYGRCVLCVSGYTLHPVMKTCYPTCGDNKIEPQEQCEDNNLTPYDGCFKCQYQCQLQCTNCQNGICYQCDNTIGYYLNYSNNKCETLCGDLIIAGVEVCEDSNNVPFDGCYNCNYSCDQFCQYCILGVCVKCQNGYQLMSQTNLCEPICGDGIRSEYEQCDDANLINYDGCDKCNWKCANCSTCLFGKCQKCAAGWVLDSRQQKCFSSCGDGAIISFYEQCDDINNNTFEDGCYQCLYSCQAECSNCVQGICLACQQNYYLGTDNLCYPLCGDGSIVKFESCDDKNYIWQDGCYNCSFQCENTCKTCKFGQCLVCQSGYYLNQSSLKCFPICGDAQQLGDEQCDYGLKNYNPDEKTYVGCVNCQLKCSPKCTLCAHGSCVQCNQAQGWYLDQETGVCSSQCGDHIINDTEQCDDYNSQQSDGCYSCQFSCQKECSNCVFGICQKCQLGYKLIDNLCYSICGDGIVAGSEQCDLGKIQLNGYGCVNCQYKCPDGCNTCFQGQCLECNSIKGWYLDSFQQKCNAKCGDFLISENEQCDDNSQLCSLCNFVCPLNCIKCSFGICSICQNGYYLTQNTCLQKCGDYFMTELEECNATDLVPFDGCFECKYQCQNQCLQCKNGECLNCDSSKGWYLNKGYCITFCGDGIQAGDEECDIIKSKDLGDISLNKCLNCKLTCVQNCSICNKGTCSQCEIGYQLTDNNECVISCGSFQVQQVSIQCNDYNLDAFDSCFSCQYNCQQECQSCIHGICIKCKVGYILNQEYCQSVCGDGIRVDMEQCDDANLVQYDGCYNCQYSCDEHCLICNHGKCEQCIDGYRLEYPFCLENCQDLILYNNEQSCLYNDCQVQCSQCIRGQCYKCQNGWYWNKEDLICESQCGDGYIVDQEQCETSILHIGWNSLLCDQQCKYQCPSNCQNCSFGVCQQCQNGYYKDGNTCNSMCGDLIVTDKEQCDDGNNLPNDGCFECHFDCPYNCQICISGICEQCNYGYTLQQLNTCQPIYGDGYVTRDEQCDDQNNKLQDGCYNSQFNCQIGCQKCIFGICQQCLEGYELIDHLCYSICGDGIVAGSEQCDLGKIQLNGYGCVNCQYKCPDGCNTCFQGQCLECNSVKGWYLDSLYQKCNAKCGDFLISENEQCDDNSQICSLCNFICPQNCAKCSFGICSICQKGYYLYQNTCVQKCGDYFMTDPEECTATDLVPFDGCFECKYQCQSQCLQCKNGECLNCDQSKGWYLNKESCLTICGDGIQAGDEECDIIKSKDLGDISLNKCLNCKLTCVQNCSICNKGTCSQCEIGYQLTDNNECVISCGSFQVQQVSIQCNDYNLDAFDSCFSCQYNCQQECQSCINGICIKCKVGYILNKEKCQSVCGDGIIVDMEQCDDANLVQYDGCYNCQYSCNQYCLICDHGKCEQCIDGYRLEYPYCLENCQDLILYNNQQSCLYNDCQVQCTQCIRGQCYKCQNGWYWNKEDLICESLCGDGYIVDQEQCENSILQIGWNSLLCDQQCKYECPSNCQHCSFGVCQQCENGYYKDGNTCNSLCGDLIITDQEQCEDGNDLPNDGCFECHFDCPYNCQTCISGICEQCNYGYSLQQLNTCQPIYGDGYVTIDEQCDDQNNKLYDGCYNCQYQCDKNCKFCQFGSCVFCQSGFELKGQKCVSICGDGIIVGNEQCDDGNQQQEDGCYECFYSCQSQCQECQLGQCLACDMVNGWYLQPSGLCEPECGDSIIAGNEQCDDGNDINFDGCFECSFICQVPCTKCLSGSCYECNTPGWYLENYYCWEFCGDGITVGREECDDGNDIPYDGCFDCKLQCDEACITCVAGYCQLCEKGWKLNDKQRCEVNCGDQYVVPQFEDCDDGNLLPYDGCYECNYQCVEFCTDCRLGICYECNTIGWAFDIQNSICIPFCGDNMIVGNEQCDDGNQIDYDGCDQNCQYSCHPACLNCQKGICIECNQYLGYFIEGNQCATQCGDRLWASEVEQCDDGNNFNDDGCSQDCQIETNWYCENKPLQVSNCIYEEETKIILDLISQSSESSIIQVTFSQKIMLVNDVNTPSAVLTQNELYSDDPNKLFKLSIEDLNESQYDYSIIPITEVEQTAKEIQYNFELIFNEAITLGKVKISIVANNELLQSQHNRKIQENSGTLVIPIIYMLSEQELKISNQIGDLSETSQYLSLGLSTFTILTQGFNTFFMTCDTLQYLYYSRYINLNFPENLQIQMNSFKKSSFSSIAKSKLGLQNQKITSEKEDKTLAKKFQQDHLSSQFDSNILSTAITMTLGLSTFVGAYSISKILHQILPHRLNSLGPLIGGAIITVRQKCTKISNEFVYSGIIRMVTVNFYELTFASLLQLQSMNFNYDQTNLINIGSAIGSLVFQGVFILVLSHKIRQLQTNQSLSMKYYIKTLFSHNDQGGQKSIWILQYNTILLGKKMLYLFIIVNFQQQPLIQTIGVGIQATVFAAYLLVSQPFSKNDEMRKALITEVGMCINSLTFCFYYTANYFQIPQNQLVNLGWMNVGVFSTVLTTHLLIDSINQVKVLYKAIKKKLDNFIQSQMPSQSKVQPIFV